MINAFSSLKERIGESPTPITTNQTDVIEIDIVLISLYFINYNSLAHDKNQVPLQLSFRWLAVAL